MQLTKLDRWLRKRFLYETHVKTLRPAEKVPRQVKAIDLPDDPLSRFRHLYVSRNGKAVDELIKNLSDNSQMFTTDIVERKRWYLPLIAPEHKSFTWNVISLMTTLAISIGAIFWVKSMLDNPKVRDGIQHALDIVE